MASPFAIFRKNQKAMFALLAIMCMIGFSIGGASDYFGNSRSSEDPVIATAYGKPIHASEVQQLVRRKQWAVSFVDRCQRAEFNLSDQLDENMAAQLMQMMGRIPAIAYFGQPTEESAVETWVLTERARRMGMVVSDGAVRKFLNDLTNNKVQPQTFGDIAKGLGIAQPQLFDALRDELMALRLREMALGRMQTTPAQRWDYYRRQHQRARVELAALPVEDFIGEVPDAATEELQAFFDAHKEQEPDPESPTPGFKVPKEADFQVVIATYSDFYDEKAVTDEEIKKHYEEFKDTRYLWDQYALQGEDEPESSDDAQKPATSGDDKPADDKGTDETESDEKSDVKTDAKPPADKNAKPAAEKDAKPATDKGDKKGAKADQKSQSLRFLRRQLLSANGALAALTGLLAADEDEAPADDKPAETPGESDETEKSADVAGKTDADESAGKKSKASKPPAVAPQITDEYLLPRDIRKGAHPKHAPLWKVEDQIRTELAREKADKKIEEALQPIREKMRKYARELGPDETEEKMPGLDKLAAAQGLSEVETGLLSALELRQKYPDLAEAKGEQRGLPFVQIAYSGMAKFQSTTVEDIEGNRYLVWKVDEREAFVPDFADVRSKVLRVWKLIKARDVAMKKAKDLAAEATKSQKPLKELLADREGLTVTQPPPFSWLTRGSANVDNRSPLRISEVEGVESPGPDFMREVFSLNVGSAGEAMNEPQTIAYVVRLESLDPPSERLRTSFLADPYALYNEVARDDVVEVQRAWIKGIEAEANLTWKDADKRRR